MNLRTLLLVLGLSGCASAAADHERLGDHAYRDGEFAVAIAEYRAALRSGASSQVWAKLGNTALRGGQLGLAVEAYTTLRVDDPSRATEAAIGLERVAEAAERGGAAEAIHLAAAVRALRSTPGRPLGRWALTPRAELGPSEAAGALPAMLASAAGRKVVDSAAASVWRSATGHDGLRGAVRTYRTVLRRSTSAASAYDCGCGSGGLRASARPRCSRNPPG